MTKNKVYKNPPLVEAVFELFYTTTNWSPVIPGVFYNEIKESFPNISKSQTGFGILLDNQGIRLGGGNSEMTQYKSQLNDTLVQLTSNLFTVNKLPKYQDWDSFKKTIHYSIDALKRSLPDIKITRIGLKFINKINIGSEHSYENFKRIFKVYPIIPSTFGNNLSSIQMNLESPVIPDTEILAVSFTSLRKEPNFTTPVIFQLYYTRVKEASELVIEDWLENAHANLHETFINGLTESCIKSFDNV